MDRCPTCNQEYDASVGECPDCAASRAEEHTCARCDASYSESDACPSCGAIREPVACERHPDRSAGGRCVICGRATCTECDKGDRRGYICEEHSDVPVIEGWAQVYSTTSEFEGQLVRDNLLAEGIDAQVFSQKDRSFQVDLGELSIVRLLVPVWEYGSALKVIQSHMDTEGEVVFACPSCGEAYEPGHAECAACSQPLM